MKLKKILPIIGILIFIFILLQLDFSLIFSLFSQIPLSYAFLSLFVFIPLLLLVTIEWQLLLKRQQIHVSYWYSIKNFFIGYFYGFITPGGFGAYTRSIYLSKESGQPLAKCVSNIITFNTIEYLSLLLIGFVGAVFLSRIYPYLFIFILIVVIIVLFLYTIFFKWSKSHQLFQKLLSYPLFSKITGSLYQSIESFHKDVPKLKDVILPFSLSISGWLIKYFLLFHIARFFNISISLYYFIFILAVADVISSIPISVYGIGTREAALITMLSVPEFSNNAFISAEQIVSLSLFWFVIIWLIPSMIGAIVTLYETKRIFAFNLDKDECERFEQYMKKYQILYQNLAKIVKRYTQKIDRPVIVDLGLGPGLLSKEIQHIIPNSMLIGLDPSMNMLTKAKNNSNIRLFSASSDKLPLENDSVDLVVTRYTLPYWKDVNKGFMEIHRVLKVNGFFIVEALNKDFSTLSLFIIKLHMILKRSSCSVAQYHVDAYKSAYQVNELIKIFKTNGFKIIKKEYKRKDWRYLIVGKKK